MEVLYNPKKFFTKKEEVSYIPALIILTLNGIISAFLAYYTIKTITPMLPVEAHQFMAIGMAIGSVFGFLTPFIKWIVLGLIFYGLSSLFGGKGSFKKLISFIGYGFIPLLIGDAIGGYIGIEVLSSMRGLTIEDLVKYREILETSLATQISAIVSILFLIWAANIFIFAVASSRNIKVKDATITVCIPIGLWVLYTLFKVVSVI
jgi:hypothetical protein